MHRHTTHYTQESAFIFSNPVRSAPRLESVPVCTGQKFGKHTGRSCEYAGGLTQINRHILMGESLFFLIFLCSLFFSLVHWVDPGCCCNVRGSWTHRLDITVLPELYITWRKTSVFTNQQWTCLLKLKAVVHKRVCFTVTSGLTVTPIRRPLWNQVYSSSMWGQYGCTKANKAASGPCWVSLEQTLMLSEDRGI